MEGAGAGRERRGHGSGGVRQVKVVESKEGLVYAGRGKGRSR